MISPHEFSSNTDSNIKSVIAAFIKFLVHLSIKKKKHLKVTTLFLDSPGPVSTSPYKLALLLFQIYLAKCGQKNIRRTFWVETPFSSLSASVL